METLEKLAENESFPVVVFFVVIGACIIIGTIAGVTYELGKFTIRGIVVLFQGWPNKHFDSDPFGVEEIVSKKKKKNEPTEPAPKPSAPPPKPPKQ